jgi:hypothetical protein
MMSNEEVASILEEFDKQVSLPWLYILNEACDRDYINGLRLDEIGRKIPGYKGGDRPITIDEETGKEYNWFFAMYFETERGEIATLFPWAKDKYGFDGTRLDRSIAIHTRGDVHEKELNEVLENVHKGLFELENRQSGKRPESPEIPDTSESPDLENGYFLIR